MSTSPSSPSAAGPELIRCEGLRIGYRAAILPPIDLSIRAGRLLAVVGRNGSGKTTWFRTLLGLTPALGGRIVRARADLTLGYVPQVASLDAILPVRARDVVAWGCQRGWSFLAPFASAADRRICAEALATAQATAFADLPYAELSEGQKQRILFARLLATQAELLLLDEPTAALDPLAERAAWLELVRLAHEHRKAVVVITHALGAARELSDDLLWLDRDCAQVVSGTAAEVVAHPDFRRHHLLPPLPTPGGTGVGATSEASHVA